MSYHDPDPIVIEAEDDSHPTDPSWLLAVTLLFTIGVVLLFAFYVRPI
jgi:hypothetical protein